MQFNHNDMNLQHRIDLMVALGDYMRSNESEWQEIKDKAFQHNPWFIPEFIDSAINAITENLLHKTLLEKWASFYHLDDNIPSKTVGIVMAGNIPMVGFHDLLSVFISGHDQKIKLSSKDDILLDHLIKKLYQLDPETKVKISVAEMLKDCDAYIATGSNNSARYFEQYFSKYPHIIRRNKTSVAILSGKETEKELLQLSDDIHLYFGLGCRNVTKIFVPQGYDFIPLIRSFDKFSYFKDHHKYNNNYDYQLSIMLMNNVFYMTNGSTLLAENLSVFSAISVVNYEYYTVENNNLNLKEEVDIQCILGNGYLPFGNAQLPGLFSYADNVDTMEFLLTL